MKYKNRIILSIILGIIGLTLISIFALPKIIYQIEANYLEQEVLEVRSSLKEFKKSKESILNLLSTDIFKYSGKELEKSVENNLKTLIDITYELNNIDYENMLSTNNLNSLENRNKTIDNINVLKNELMNYKEKCNTLIKENNIYLDNKELNNYILKTDDILDTLNYYNEIIEFLNNTNDYYIKDNNIIFTKKNTFLGYKEILTYLENKNLDIINAKIENDNVAPVVTPRKLELFVGTKNLKDTLKCIDEIDGEVECKISGNYNLEVIGNYNVVVEAIDSASNYVKKNVELNVKEKIIGPYYTEIIRNQNTVIVYGLDENKQYTKVVNVFACSTGRGGRTPTGTFYTTKGAPWGPLMGGVWGQYYTMITPSILFHSVPYYSMSKDNLEWQEYNKLGEEASAGCVRLSTTDAKWIYDNCPSGMRVRIYDGELPEGVVKPTPIKIDPNSQFRGWDPTDPDINNPWKK